MHGTVVYSQRVIVKKKKKVRLNFPSNLARMCPVAESNVICDPGRPVVV